MCSISLWSSSAAKIVSFLMKMKMNPARRSRSGHTVPSTIFIILVLYDD
jgi:hypothetical protein